jgi:hypothetical protein
MTMVLRTLKGIIEGIPLQDHNELTFRIDPKSCNMQEMGGIGKTRTNNTHGCGVDESVGTFRNTSKQ